MPNRLYLFILCFLPFAACSDVDQADPLTPVTITRGEISLTVDPALGGRISSLTFGGRELLQTTRDSANLHWGSIAWSSPQADWDWPPPAAFDSEPFTLTELGEKRLLLEGPLDSASQLRMRKRYVLGPDSDIGLTYWLTYEGATSTTVALWENTRLPYAGRFEFGAADSVAYRGQPPVLEQPDSTLYVLHIDERQTAAGKLSTDLPLGYADWIHDGIRLRKHSVVTERYRTAPGQGPLELYVDPVERFAEFELQGDYRRLGPGESSNLRAKWEISVIDR